jgi:hypothetical protein
VSDEGQLLAGPVVDRVRMGVASHASVYADGLRLTAAVVKARPPTPSDVAAYRTPFAIGHNHCPDRKRDQVFGHGAPPGN